MNDDAAVRDLARRAGIAVEWTNAAGVRQVVTAEVLRHVLAALGLPAVTSHQTAESRDHLRAGDQLGAGAPLVTAITDRPITLIDRDARSSATASLVLESGGRRDVRQKCFGHHLTLDGIGELGYHALYVGDRVVTLAVAPKKCFTPEVVSGGCRLWGLAAQLYGLRHAGDGGIGNTSGLSALATGAAKLGADAIALSPTHALFSADFDRYGPYSPSSDPSVLFGKARVCAGVSDLGMADRWSPLESDDLIDRPASSAAKFALFRLLFDELRKDCERGKPGTLGRAFAAFRENGGDLLEQHARFGDLHAFRLAADPHCWSRPKWPKAWQDPRSAEVNAFAAANPREVAFQVFLQWMADRSLAAAQAHARASGMMIGLIADVAIGMDAGGSHAWSLQEDLVVGLNVGAPPYNPLGQDWGLTTFSPRALLTGGFAPFLATLWALTRNAGGVRIDHAMGLTRVWLIPEGASPAEGAYLNYPLDDLLRLIKLESVRHSAIVIGEDLGTVPEGFQEALADAGVAGMHVLRFERDGEKFRSPDAWPPRAVAMTTTHDLPTVAGWWRGADIDARGKLGRLGPDGDIKAENRTREQDRKPLWHAFPSAGVADCPGMPKNSDDAVDAAVRFIAATPAQLAVVPLEDMLGLVDQPNLPGTVTEHPNWRRRYPERAVLIFEPEVQRRARSLRMRSGQ